MASHSSPRPIVISSRESAISRGASSMGLWRTSRAYGAEVFGTMGSKPWPVAAGRLVAVFTRLSTSAGISFSRTRASSINPPAARRGTSRFHIP